MREGGPWQSTVGRDLAGSTFGVIGLGKIGTRVAKVAKAFDMDVIAWSPHLTEERADAAGVRLAASKRDLLFNSDVVSLHLQLSWSTRRIIDAGDIAAMRRNAYFVNTARAGLVDNDALVAALQQGRLAGAGLDVFDEEPLPADHPLRTLPERAGAAAPRLRHRAPTTAPTSPRRSRTSRPGSPGSPFGSSAERVVGLGLRSWRRGAGRRPGPAAACSGASRRRLPLSLRCAGRAAASCFTAAATPSAGPPVTAVAAPSLWWGRRARQRCALPRPTRCQRSSTRGDLRRRTQPVRFGRHAPLSLVAVTRDRRSSGCASSRTEGSAEMRTACAGDRARILTGFVHALSLRSGRSSFLRGRVSTAGSHQCRRRRPMARADKQAAVAEIVESFNDAAGAVLTEYRGLTVKELQDLRRSLGEHADYAVVKNTLAKLAAQEAGIAGFDELLTGPTAIAFLKGDVVEAAKGLRDFAKANPALIIKGGYPRRQGDRREGGREARRPRVARRAAGQARGRHARLAPERRLPVQRPASPRSPGSPVRCRRRPSRTPRSSLVVPARQLSPPPRRPTGRRGAPAEEATAAEELPTTTRLPPRTPPRRRPRPRLPPSREPPPRRPPRPRLPPTPRRPPPRRPPTRRGGDRRGRRETDAAEPPSPTTRPPKPDHRADHHH